MVNFDSIFTLASDVMNDLPDIEKSIGIAKSIIASIEQGQMPALSQADMDTFKADMADLEKIVTDIKALV